MKRLLLTLLFLPFIYVCALGQNKTLAVGTTTPNPNAALQVESPTNNQGFIMPRLTTVQRTAMNLAVVDKGLSVYDTDLNLVYVWNGAMWNSSLTSSSIFPLSVALTNTDLLTKFNALDITYLGDSSRTLLNLNYANALSTKLSNPFRITHAGQGAAMVLTQSGTAGTGALFQLSNAANPRPAVSVFTNGTGPAGVFGINNAGNNAAAISASTNGTGAAINARNTGVGTGFAGFFSNSDPANTFPAVQGITAGVGSVFRAFQTSGPGGGMDIFMFNATSSAPGLHVTARHLGVAGQFLIDNAANPSSVIIANTNGTGDAIFSQINNATSTNAAVKGRSINIGGGAGAFEIFNSANARTAVYAETQGTGSAGDFNINNVASGSAALRGNTNGTGSAGVFNIDNAGNNAAAISATTNGVGAAVFGFNSGPGDSFSPGGHFIVSNPTNNHAAVQGNNSGNGSAGLFLIENPASTSSAINGNTNGTGAAIQANHTGASGNIAHFQSGGINVARIDKTGRGFFNGGTQTGGADVAEMFDVEGNKSDYEPGDVLVISESTDRTIEKSSSSYSTKVAGVYATKPGVTLTEKDINESIDGLVPMGVIGVIPTKVSLENGAIKRGDLLVTSSTSGYAMKAVSKNGDGIFPAGVIIGKALENFEGASKGKIRVLVNIK